MTINSSAKSLFQQPLLFHCPPPKLATTPRKHIRKIVRSNFPLRSCNPVRYKIHEWSRLRILEDDSSCENEHRYVARFPVLIKWEMEIWLFLGRWDRSIEPRTRFPNCWECGIINEGINFDVSSEASIFYYRAANKIERPRY